MHEQRVERHCLGIEETIQNLQKQYNDLQNDLKETSEVKKKDIFNMETLFNTANKSLR